MSYNPINLTRKVILVTGASSGIGRAIAIECSRLGATCILTARNKERLHKTLAAMEGEGHTVIPTDLTDTAAVVALVEQLPKLDGVSHNVGINNRMLCNYAKMESIRQMFDINFFSIVQLQTLLLRKRRMNKKSCILLMSSLATRVQDPANGFYACSKAALTRYMHDLASELKPKQIRCNSVHPGMVETPLTSHDFGEDIMEKDKKRYIYGRYGRPEEIAHLVAYLMSDAAEWITNSEFDIGGGGN